MASLARDIVTRISDCDKEQRRASPQGQTGVGQESEERVIEEEDESTFPGRPIFSSSSQSRKGNVSEVLVFLHYAVLY